jgi:hypothetical protein
MQLAQQMAAARAAQSRAIGAAYPSLNGAAPRWAVAFDNAPSAALSVRGEPSSDLRVTPEE